MAEPKPIEANLLQMAGMGLEIVVRLEKKINELREEIASAEEALLVYDAEGKAESYYYCQKRIDENNYLLGLLERIMDGP